VARPVPTSSRPSRRSRELIARLTAVVHNARTPRWAIALLAELDINVEMVAAGRL
jgi:hypothetical protein